VIRRPRPSEQAAVGCCRPAAGRRGRGARQPRIHSPINAAPPDGGVTVTGLLRADRARRRLSAPQRPCGRPLVFTRCMPLHYAWLGVRRPGRPALWMQTRHLPALELVPGQPGGLTVIALSTAMYALTWFALALMSAAQGSSWRVKITNTMTPTVSPLSRLSAWPACQLSLPRASSCHDRLSETTGRKTCCC
jgi:hypothetical protein